MNFLTAIGTIIMIIMTIGFTILGYRFYNGDEKEFAICSIVIVALAAAMAYLMN